MCVCVTLSLPPIPRETYRGVSSAMPATATKHERIKDREARCRSSRRRTRSLLKKGQELSLLTDSDIGIIILDQNNNLTTYGSDGIEKTLWRYLKYLPQRDAMKYEQDQRTRESRRRLERAGEEDSLAKGSAEEEKREKPAGRKRKVGEYASHDGGEFPEILTRDHMPLFLDMCSPEKEKTERGLQESDQEDLDEEDGRRGMEECREGGGGGGVRKSRMRRSRSECAVTLEGSRNHRRAAARNEKRRRKTF